MAEPLRLDRSWVESHPLPSLPCDLDKNSRGRVVVIGGCPKVPGGVRLTAEAALRAGAGKVQMAVPEPIALGLGYLVPEAGVIAIADRIARNDDFFAAISEADCVVIGPAMTSSDAAEELLLAAIDHLAPDATLLVDAVALGNRSTIIRHLKRISERCVMTPNPGELATLLQIGIEEVREDPLANLRRAVEEFGTTVISKDTRTHIRSPAGDELQYEGGGPGLATGGSGDVLAGIVGGLMSRSNDPFRSAGWGVWLHGEAGSQLRREVGNLGFLAREIAPLVPSLLDQPTGP